MNKEVLNPLLPVIAELRENGFTNFVLTSCSVDHEIGGIATQHFEMVNKNTKELGRITFKVTILK
jgi:hypothetical protein